MGTIKPSKDQNLVAGYSRVDSKSKKKSTKPPEQKRDKNKSQEEPQGSKKNFQKKNKGEMRKCTYYSKGYHPERSCIKNQVDMLNQLLEKNGISLPDISKKNEGGSNL